MNTKQKAPGEAVSADNQGAIDPVGHFLEVVRNPGKDVSTQVAEMKDQRNAARDLLAKQVGARCKQARGSMEVADAAAALGVHRNTIWNIERGDTLPDAFEIEVLSRMYKTSTEWLLTGREPAKAANLIHDQRLLNDVVEGVLEALEDQGLKLPNKKVAQLVDLIYEHEIAASASTNAPTVKRTAERFLRLVSA